MDTEESQNIHRSTAYAPMYKAKRGYVASLVIILSSVGAFLLSLGMLSFENLLGDGPAFAGGISLLMIVIFAPTFCIGKKARNRRICWVRAYMIMSIISAMAAVAQIVWSAIFVAICATDSSCTVTNKVCISLSVMSSVVTFVASITASCTGCKGLCSCCNCDLPTPPVLMPDATPYRVFENEQEPQMDVAPDVDGLYTDWEIKKAEPRREQFDPEENYVLHTSVFKGLVLIINNDRFHEGNRRLGSEIDLLNIEHVFKQIGYKPVIKKNLTADEIRRFLDSSVERIRLEGPSYHSSVVLVLMSHGEKRGILGTDLGVVTIQEIKSMFSGRRCPALLGKPKIFFIQACRGKERTKSALDTDNLRPRRNELEDGSDIDSYPSCSSCRRPLGDAVETDGDVPDNADIYVAHATSEGYYSIRDRVTGSWFIQALCEELIAHVHVDDLDTMMNRVTRRVTGCTGTVIDSEGKKKKMLQTPDISKQGIGKKIYFLPKYQSLPNEACRPSQQQDQFFFFSKRRIYNQVH